MAPCLQIKLLGDFRLTWDGRVSASVGTGRMRSLLAYLILRRGSPQARAHVAFQFWPDSSEKQALTNLRHLLHELRRAWPESDEFVQADNRTLGWRTDVGFALDVADFDRAFARAQEATQRADHVVARAALETAVQAYAGDLLPGCYGDWVMAERERLRRLFGTTLEQLVSLQEAARDYAAATRHAKHLREFDPTRETTYLTLMRLQLLAGDRAAALHTYETCVATLEQELQVGPGQAVRELRERALADQFGSESRTMAGARPLCGTPELSLRGRHAEWQVLRTAWTDAAAGRAGAVVLLGEAGIGKSRLAEELCVWVERQGNAVARTRSYAAEGRLAYAPAVQWLRSAALHSRLTNLDAVWRTEVARILPEMRPDPGSVRGAAGFQESWQRHHLFEALSRALLAGNGPVLLLLDDLQWTDQETLEWLRYLMRFAPAARLLLVGTIRVEELPSHVPLQRLLEDLRRDDQLTEIELGPLSASDAAAVAADVAGSALEAGDAARLYAETEGNPLFVVERVRAGWRDQRSEGTGVAPAAGVPVRGSSLPPKVHGVITTRLAQLTAPARELAAVAAVLGRAFAFDLLVAVCEWTEEELVPVLQELWQRRIIREQSGGTFDFTHDKLREVAYAEIIAPRRRLLHRRAAGVLEANHADDPDVARAQVAAHLEAAGQMVKAIAAYQSAAEVARNLHATEEAIRLFQKALGLLRSLPANPARAGQELELNTGLGVCLVASQGYPASRVWGIYDRSRELCRQLGRPTEAPILRALAIASLTSGDLQRAHALGHELLEDFARRQDPVVYVEGHYVLGVSCFWLGRFTESRDHLEQSIAHYNPRWRGTHISLYAQDPKAVCLCRLAWTLWYLGYPERARAIFNEAREFARELDHPHTEGYVLYFGAQLACDLRDEAGAREILDALERLTARHTLLFWEYRGQILKSFLQASRSGSTEAITRAREHMATYAGVGNFINFSQFLGYAAELYRRQRAPDQGRAAIAEAFDLLQRIDERYYNAELHRLEGEILRLQGAPGHAQERCFRRAQQMARKQDAKSLELRAAVSLGRLWHDQGKRTPARRLLTEAFAWFSEGFDTADLRDARALLDQWR